MCHVPLIMKIFAQGQCKDKYDRKMQLMVKPGKSEKRKKIVQIEFYESLLGYF